MISWLLTESMKQVNETLRREFESEWSQGKSPSIASYLPAADSEEYLPTLEELVCIDLEFRWKLDGDQDPPLLENYLERFGELRETDILQRLVEQEIWVRAGSANQPSAGEYAKRFPEVVLLPSTFRRMLSDRATVRLEEPKANSRRDQQAAPERIGDYRILSLLGRGGMGAVYRAQHLTTERIVALKLADIGSLPPEFRAEGLRRVEQEIRASAKLSHDNLVPVYDVGDFNEQPYYTMPVLSADLAQRIRSSPLSGAKAADYLMQAARGVQAAHDAELLHRDLKPHNLMIDDSVDRVLVADFGLARCAAESNDLTRTGQVLGTPPYMAPEQIRDAQSVDHRADVYSLGATLYHVLTGRPPFGASEPAETLRQVLDEDPPLLRDLNRAIDLDLETICLRCLHKEPSLRYQTAGEFADDLQRYLRNEPIHARPLSSLGRLARWQRRNPALAKLTAGLAMSLLALAIVGSVGWVSTRFQLKRVIETRRHVQATIDELFYFVMNEPEFRQPGDEDLRRKLLQRGLGHYRRLAELAKDDRSLQAEVLKAQVTVALMKLELDGPDPAIADFNSVIAAHKALPESIRDRPIALISLGDGWNGLARAQRLNQDLTDALKSFSNAIDVREQVVSTAFSVDADRKLANARMNRGLVHAALGSLDDALDDQGLAQTSRLKLLENPATSSSDRENLNRDIAQGLFNLSRVRIAQGNFEAAGKIVTDASKRFDLLVRNKPRDWLLWRRLIDCMLLESELTNDPSVLARAAEYLEQLAMSSPSNRIYQLGLIDSYHRAIDNALRFGEPGKAQVIYRKVQRQVLERFPQDDQQVDLLRRRITHQKLEGLIALESGKSVEAKELLESALNRWEASSAVAAVGEDEEWQAIRNLLKAL